MSTIPRRAEPDPDSFSYRWHNFARLGIVMPGILGDNQIAVALTYLILLCLAEVVTVFLSPQAGMVMHLLLLLLLLVHAAATWQRPIHRLLMGLAFVPLIRVISLSLPLAGIPLIFWYLATSVPLFVAIVIAFRLLDMRLVGPLPRLRGLPFQLAIGATGLFLGYVEYRLLQPQSLIVGFSWGLFAIAAMILLFSTGYVEELVFRRIMQRTAVEHFGWLAGIFYVSLLFAILHIGYRSVIDFFFVLVVGFSFGLIVARTGSLLGVSLSHGLTNIVLFLVIPHMISGDITIPMVDTAAIGLEAPPAVQAVEIAETPSPLQGARGARPPASAVGTAPPTDDSPPTVTPQPSATSAPATSNQRPTTNDQQPTTSPLPNQESESAFPSAAAYPHDETRKRRAFD